VDLDAELDDLLSWQKAPNHLCSIQFVYQKLSPEHAEKLKSLVDAGVVPASRIVAILNKHGFDIRCQTVFRHRNRSKGSGCRCP
jgi:hypothetical protein